MNKLNAVLSTNGQGYWSEAAKAVRITGFDVPYISDEGDFGELRVYFSTNTWDVDKHGLIYTDPQFIAQLRDLFNRKGFAGDDVEYSEQGMQGDDYVSLDIGEDFIKSFSANQTMAKVLA